jgi:hypothetical protein
MINKTQRQMTEDLKHVHYVLFMRQFGLAWVVCLILAILLMQVV